MMAFPPSLLLLLGALCFAGSFLFAGALLNPCNSFCLFQMTSVTGTYGPLNVTCAVCSLTGHMSRVRLRSGSW